MLDLLQGIVIKSKDISSARAECSFITESGLLSSLMLLFDKLSYAPLKWTRSFPKKRRADAAACFHLLNVLIIWHL